MTVLMRKPRPCGMTATREARPIAFHSCHRAAGEADYVMDALNAGHFRAGGSYCAKATQELARRTGSPLVHLTNSCTSAMEIAALALDLGPGDEVIVPSYTFVATATAFARTGASIVLCDIDPQTMMIDPADVEQRITNRTRAIVPVHYGGHAANMERLKELCSGKSIYLVEDAAQGIGASRNGAALGTIGDLGAYSFHETKIAHCGHGGALLVNRQCPDIARRIDEALQRGTNFSDCRAGLVSHYEWTAMGSSFQPTGIDAAILYSQLLELDHILAKRRHIDALYRQLLQGIDAAILGPDPATLHNGHAVTLLMENADRAKDLINRAVAAGIGVQSHYKPLHLSKFGRGLGYAPGDLPHARAMWERLVRLPIHTNMSEGDVHRVADFIR